MTNKVLFIATIALGFSTLSEAAIVSTGGTLQAMNTTITVPDTFGQYHVYGERQTLMLVYPGHAELGVSASAEWVLDFSADGIHLFGTAFAGNYMLPDPPYLNAYDFGSGNGQLGFNLDVAGDYLFGWVTNRAWYPTNATLTRDGSVVLECYASICQRSNGETFNTEGLLSLGAGHYELAFNVGSDYGAGWAYGSDLSLSLTPVVPLPAAVWLLLSGLGALGGITRGLASSRSVRQ